MRSVRGALLLVALVWVSLVGSQTAASALDLRAPVHIAITIADSGAIRGGGAGRPVTVSVRVSPVTGVAVPTGVVTLRHDGAPIGSGSMSQGRVDFRAGLLAGTHTYSADYDGDDRFLPTPASDTPASAVSYTAGREGLATQLSSSSERSGAVTFALSLAFQPSVPPADDTDGWADVPTSLPLAPTGTVVLSDNGMAVGAVPVVTPVTMVTTSLAPAHHVFEARYSGDPNFETVASEPLVYDLAPAAGLTSTTVAPAQPSVASVTLPTAAPAAASEDRPSILAGLLSSGRPAVTPSLVAPGAPVVIPGSQSPTSALSRSEPIVRRTAGHDVTVLVVLAATMFGIAVVGAGWLWRRRVAPTSRAPA